MQAADGLAAGGMPERSAGMFDVGMAAPVRLRRPGLGHGTRFAKHVHGNGHRLPVEKPVSWFVGLSLVGLPIQ